MYSMIEVRTKMDTNGNKRRLWILLNNDSKPIRAWDQIYNVPDEYHELHWNNLIIHVQPSEYKRLKKLYSEN